MFEQVTESSFRNTFRNIRPENFSREGLGVLFEYLEGYEEDTGEKIEFDCIAICCDFAEYTREEFLQDYDSMFPTMQADQELDPELEEFTDKDLQLIGEHCTVIRVYDDTVIVSGL